jgi:hypothetical protein
VSWRAFGCIWSSTARCSSTASTPTLITFGHPCPVSDLFGVAGRELEFPRFRGCLAAVLFGRRERMSVDARDTVVFGGVLG